MVALQVHSQTVERPADKVESLSASQQFQRLYEAGDYRAALKPGALALSRATGDNALRLQLANCLAWTGRYDAATELYERLIPDTNFSVAARTGLANLLRWRGAPHVAIPLLEMALKDEPKNKEPKNADLKTSVQQTQRDLKPLSTVKLSRASDSAGLDRLEVGASQRVWQQDSIFGRPLRLDLAAIAGQDTRAGLTSKHTEVGLSLVIPPMPSASSMADKAASQWSKNAGARLELSLQKDLKTRAFGRAHVDLMGDALSLRAGHFNWGRQVFSQSALLAGLTANQVGMSTNINAYWMQVRGRLDSYSVSDNNKILDAELSMTPGWQPLPLGLQWMNTVAYRKANRVDGNYWSPLSFAADTVSVKRSWYFEQGEFNASLGRSFALAGDAKNGFSLAANGRYWVGRDTALGFDMSASDAPRVGAYRYNYVGISLSQLW
jgi:tetratricopeptide (TPR) repeat protein